MELVKDRLKVPRSHILRARWVLTWKNVGTDKVPKARLCALGFRDPRLTTLPTSSPTLTSDGESAILQWIVNEGHLLESGDLKTAFLSGDPDPCVETAKGSIWPHQRTPPMASEAQPSPSTSWFCATANGPVCLDSPCIHSCEKCFPCRCANQVESSRCRFLCFTCS